jgi:antitoxin component YwqK of YwqJK toxin-antitoxin module
MAANFPVCLSRLRSLLPLLPIFAFGLPGCAPKVAYEVRKTTYPDGTLRKEALFSDRGTKEGKYLSYHPDGRPKVMALYDSDRPVGPRVVFWPNGAVKKVEYHAEYKKNGPTLQYDSTGRLEVMTEYKAGKIEGVYNAYHPNGRVMYTGVTSNGHPFGVRMVYDSLGNPFQGLFEGQTHGGARGFSGKVVNGKPDSLFSYFFRGTLYMQVEFKDGLMQGEHRFLTKRGKVDSSWIFESGRYVRTVKNRGNSAGKPAAGVTAVP